MLTPGRTDGLSMLGGLYSFCVSCRGGLGVERERGGGERGSDRGKGERGEIEAVKTGRHIERQGNTEREEKGRENKQKMKHVSV